MAEGKFFELLRAEVAVAEGKLWDHLQDVALGIALTLASEGAGPVEYWRRQAAAVLTSRMVSHCYFRHHVEGHGVAPAHSGACTCSGPHRFGGRCEICGGEESP